MAPRVLISDALSDTAVNIFRERGIDADFQPQLGKDKDALAWKTVRCRRTPDIYRRFIKSIRTGVNDQPDFARGAANQKVLDACFESDRTGKAVRV